VLLAGEKECCFPSPFGRKGKGILAWGLGDRGKEKRNYTFHLYVNFIDSPGRRGERPRYPQEKKDTGPSLSERGKEKKLSRNQEPKGEKERPNAKVPFPFLSCGGRGEKKKNLPEVHDSLNGEKRRVGHKREERETPRPGPSLDDSAGGKEGKKEGGGEKEEKRGGGGHRA